MALKPTIYKALISLSDLDRNFYDTLSLTIAQHPSENIERMMARVLAYCINADEGIVFTAGISTPNEPDIQITSLDGQLRCWIDVGEPSSDRIKKATRLADKTHVFSFNSKSDVWWSKERDKFKGLSAIVYQFPWSQIQRFGEFADRTMNLSITISGQTAFVNSEAGDCEISWYQLTE
ncbi:MAG: hypothetical protein ACI9P7_000518 [Candidatus Azotimanducaceae bacterium]|jgi:uncharacterized protein YaeQ